MIEGPEKVIIFSPRRANSNLLRFPRREREGRVTHVQKGMVSYMIVEARGSQRVFKKIPDSNIIEMIPPREPNSP